jgi:signal peptidase I
MAENPYADIVAQALEERGTVRTAFSGRSMAPTLADGMTLEVAKALPCNIRAGDIILYKKGGQTVVHRVIRVSRDGKGLVFFTKGDNHSLIAGDYVPEENVIGKITAAFPPDAPQKNLLVDNKLLSLSYVAMGRLADFALRAKGSLPRLVKSAFRYIAGGLFLAFKKSIHTTYIGTRHGKLFFGRYGKGTDAV